MKKQITIGAAVVLITSSTLFGLAGITDIAPGQGGVQIKMIGSDRGTQPEVLTTGTRWVNPITYDIAEYDTKKKQFTIEGGLSAATKDGQPINIDISVEMGLTLTKLPYLHEKVGTEYFDQIVYPALRSAVRDATSGQKSSLVYTGEGRKFIQDSVLTTLAGKFDEYGIVIDVNLREITFTNSDFVAALERKAVAAEQEVIKKREAAAADGEAEE